MHSIGRPYCGRYASVISKFLLWFILVLCSATAAAQEPAEEIEPIYPMSPVCRDLSGVVKVAFEIDEHGVPHKINVIEAETEIFNRAAIKTLMKYRFKEGTFVVGSTYNKILEFKPKQTCHRNA
ncbi:TonB family protein [Microbulbifer sp. SSSA005]|uniref:TonB family protein n=1 Tax=Microbulbifer sp. SSSA005 TaxID=3243378 RepID=UPI00403A28FA